ncbi:uncharacterized protein EV154DRAFT_587217 [Mucor mucedo]|uniref:uncharacterized protein n=1 Tax=Mucor mucedo TaxID=29922 RepID=UPI00221EC3F2|nr:uncharacterized protein EV154DRAFT_587217 [Mucor mucedo]KAI7891949.1 hypothetical protein EV154DRAFT_587217 [Mucor mucedo]
MITPIPPQISSEMRESENNVIRNPPPPAYQDTIGHGFVGETYYQPPPPPPTPPPPPPPAMATRVTEFYSPPNNRRLAMRRRFSTFFCVFFLLVIVVGLAAGLTRTGYDSCECRSNEDCVGLYGRIIRAYNQSVLVFIVTTPANVLLETKAYLVKISSILHHSE